MCFPPLSLCRDGHPGTDEQGQVEMEDEVMVMIMSGSGMAAGVSVGNK